MRLNLGIGLTSKCNCSCEHCYSRTYNRETDLNIEKVMRFCELFDVASVNFGTGESALHLRFVELSKHLKSKGIKVSLTTNGYSTNVLEEAEFELFSDIDFSLDFPTAELHDSSRKSKQYDLVLNGIKQCKKMHIPCSIALCLMPQNHMYTLDMIKLCKKLEVNLRINIYKPIASKGLSYQEFWDCVTVLLENSRLVSCSEPIVNAALDNKNSFAHCGNGNVRIFPDETVSQCVYINYKKISLDDLFDCKNEEEVVSKIYANSPFCDVATSKICMSCDYYGVCKGGCEARRIISHTDIDEFCFVQQNEKRLIFPKAYNMSRNTDFVHSDYLCTIIIDPLV